MDFSTQYLIEICDLQRNWHTADKGMVDKVIAVLVDAEDYLWAALIAKNSGLDFLSQNFYRDGLQYYIGMEMFGRATSVAAALGIFPDVTGDLYRNGIVRDIWDTDLVHRRRDIIECAIQSLDLSSWPDEISQQLMKTMQEQRERMAKEGQGG